MKPLDPAKLQDLLVKLRKGSTASFSLAQIQALVEVLGGSLEPVLVAIPYGSRRGGRASVYAGNAVEADNIMAWLGARKVSAVPSKPKPGVIYVTEAEIANHHGSLSVEFVGSVGGTAVNVSWGGKSATLIPGETYLPHIDSLVLGAESRKPVTSTFDVLQWLNTETDWVAKANELLGMEAHAPAVPRTRDGTGSCPVCFQNIKLKPGSNPTMVLHGYERPGHGYVHGKCKGVGFAPYELSDKGTKNYLELLQRQLQGQQARLKTLTADDIYEVVSNGKTVAKGDSAWGYTISNEISNTARAVEDTQGSIVTYTKIIDNWQLRSLPEVGVPHIDWYTAALRGRTAGIKEKVKALEEEVTALGRILRHVETRNLDDNDKVLFPVSIAEKAKALHKNLVFEFEDTAKGILFKKSTPGRQIENFRKILASLGSVTDWDGLQAVLKAGQTKVKYLSDKYRDYADLAIGALKYFDSDLDETIWVDNYTVSLITTARGGWTRDIVQVLEEILVRTNRLMDGAGLGSVTGGRVFAYNSDRLPGSTGRGSNTVASIHSGTKRINLAVGSRDITEVTSSLVHELGHKLYFTLDGTARELWEKFFGDNVQPPDVDGFLRNWKDWIDEPGGSLSGYNRSSFSNYYDHLKKNGTQSDVMWAEVIYDKVGIKESDYRSTGPSAYDQVLAKKAEIKAFLYPVSAYSTTNASELFAEVLSFWLVHGSARVPEIVRGVFVQMVPRIKRSSELGYQVPVMENMGQANSSRVAGRFVVANELPTMDAIVQELAGLETLERQIRTVVETYSDHVVMPLTDRKAAVVGKVAAVSLLSQTDAVAKAKHGMRRCEWVVNTARGHLVADPTNDEAASCVRDALLLWEKFNELGIEGKKMLSALSQKLMPEDLKVIAQETIEGLRAIMNDPQRMSVTVTTRFVPVAVGDSFVDGMESLVFLYMYASPTDDVQGVPEYNMFQLLQNTLDKSGVTLTPILRDKSPDVAKVVKVKSGKEAIGQIRKHLKGWSALDKGI